jgi:hypothetical protein
MKRNSRQPEPAMIDAPPARSLYVAVYGGLAARSVPPEQGTQDAYSLFYARSAAMKWLTSAVGDSRRGLWGMNEAETTFNPESNARVAFFQVALTANDASDSLPVQPFLACVADVLTRIGSLRLDAVQILLPEHNAQPAEEIMDAANWFADSARTPVRVTLDGGLDPSIRASGSVLAERIQTMGQDVFSCDEVSLNNEDHLVLLPTTFDAEPGSAHHRVTMRGTLAEWSLDALGWLAALLADATARNGTGTQMMLTADRSTY